MTDNLLGDTLRIYNISCSLEKKLVKLYVTDQGIGRQDGQRLAIVSTDRNPEALFGFNHGEANGDHHTN